MGIGQISLLVDSPLRTVSIAFRGLDADVRKQITKATKAATTTIWAEETRERALTRLQQRVLAGTSRTGVSGVNVRLMAGGGARLSSGTRSNEKIVKATEFGAYAYTKYDTTSRKDKAYKRRHGDTFGAPRRNGNVVYPAAKDAIPRVASLVVQTTIRTVHESIEGASNG